MILIKFRTPHQLGLMGRSLDYLEHFGTLLGLIGTNLGPNGMILIEFRTPHQLGLMGRSWTTGNAAWTNRNEPWTNGMILIKFRSPHQLGLMGRSLDYWERC